MPDIVVGYARRKIRWNPDPEPVVAIEAKPSPVPQTGLVPPPPKPARAGNGHKSVKVRNLDGNEKDVIRTIFIKEGGTAADDRWVSLHKTFEHVVGIFQVTGFVSYLHREVAMGKLTFFGIRMSKYEAFMKTRRNLWATYNSPKYRAMRAEAQTAIASPDPKFASGFPGRKLRGWSS